MGIFLEGEDSRGDHGLGRFVEFRFKAPPGNTSSSITTRTPSGQRNYTSWASQSQKSITLVPCPGGRTTKSTKDMWWHWTKQKFLSHITTYTSCVKEMLLVNFTGVKVSVCSVRATYSRPFTAKARFYFQASPCGIYGEQSDTKTCFPPGSSGCPCLYNSTIVPYQLFYPLFTLCKMEYLVRQLFVNPALRLGIRGDCRLPLHP